MFTEGYAMINIWMGTIRAKMIMIGNCFFQGEAGLIGKYITFLIGSWSKTATNSEYLPTPCHAKMGQAF